MNLSSKHVRYKNYNVQMGLFVSDTRYKIGRDYYVTTGVIILFIQGSLPTSPDTQAPHSLGRTYSSSGLAS